MSANETHVGKHAKPGISEQPLLQVEDLHLRFGGLNALSGVSFNVNKGHIQAIIGPNGAGKTCSLNCSCRFYQPYRGRVVFEGKDISKVATHRVAALGIARSFQNIELFKGMTVLDNIKLGRHVHMHSGFFSGGIYLGRAKKEEIKVRTEIEEQIIDLTSVEVILATIRELA